MIRFGSNDSALTGTAVWRYIAYASGTEAGLNATTFASGQTNPTDLRGKVLTTRPGYVDDGVSVALKRGPAFASDDWHIDARHDYPVEAVHPADSPSPRRTWRSTDTSAAEIIAWDVDADATQADWPSGLLAVYLDKINAGVVDIGLHNGAWTSYTFDLRQRVKWTRRGEMALIEYATSSGVEMRVQPDEWAGWALQFGTAGTGDVRRITRNTGGLVSNGATAKIPRVYMDGIDGGEGTTGDGLLWPTRAVLLIPLESDDTADRPGKVRIQLSKTAVPVPPEGYWEIGVAAVGSVHLFGKDPDHNRRRSWSSNVDLRTAADGSRQSRKRGPNRQVVNLTWSQLDTRPWYSSTADDHIDGSSESAAYVAAHRHETAALLEGLLDHLDGDSTPCVYLPSVPGTTTKASPSAIVLNKAGGAVYGRIIGGLSLSSSLGDELSSELLSASLTIEEEV
jgi:hypothetical protein